MRDVEAPRLFDGYTRNVLGCERCRAQAAVHAPVYGISGRTQLMEFIAPDARLLELLVAGETEAAHHHARAVLRVPSIHEDATDRIAAGQACPLDIEDELGLFKDTKRFAGHQLVPALEAV
jgi:type II secretory ATPase GspE/PulE/Tfp pilus assembly ATPase PilB-like protein